MKETINLFEESEFFWKSNLYIVKSAKIVNQKAVIVTDKKSFVYFDNEYQEFFKEVSASIVRTKNAISENIKNFPIVQKPEEQVHQAIVVNLNNRATRMADKLEEIFNLLSESGSNDIDIKKADAMVKLSNAVVASELVRFKYLNIK
jgi:hypothetical protein